MDWYGMTARETLEKLMVDPASGLNDSAVLASGREHGHNSYTREDPVPMWRRIWEASSEPMMLMLMSAGAIAVGVNLTQYFRGGHYDFLECAGIFVAIVLSVAITVIMEGRSAKAFEALNNITQDNAVRVMRNGEVQLVPQKDVVVGDVVILGTGDRVPADGRLIEAVSMASDESSLTGESEPSEKDAAATLPPKTPVADRVNMVYSGCFITGGHGTMAVTAVGNGTEFGKIASELSSTEHTTTPLQEKMARMGKRITLLGACAAGVVFAVQMYLFFRNGAATLDNISEAFITSIVLIVAAVPEGLPTIVAVSLSINIIKMSRQNALVKKMVACETVGCIDVICSDKTGTLTENRMSVSHVVTPNWTVAPEALKSDTLIQNFCVNGTADVHFEDGRPPVFIGNPTECALIVAARKAGADYKDVRARSEILHTYPFSSDTKKMTTVIKHCSTVTACTKGAPERILALCRMDMCEKREAETAIESFQSRACRVIAFAHKALQSDITFDENRETVEQDMVYDGFVAITDPLRADVPDAVKTCRAAGIEIKILTGDNIVTARAIATELGVLGDGHGRAVEAGELEEMDDAEFARAITSVRVIARSTPRLKMRVVQTLKKQGHVVAVTGDGINDAPAIKNADVGLAMGISGTDVSKEASDIVLLDDSFATIEKAVQWGRGIYENFQRFIQFQLTVNLSSVIAVLFSILAGFKAPFTALQLLWINIIMDGPPALTLGLEPIRDDLMSREPTKRDASIVSKAMMCRIAINGLYISALFLGQQIFNFLGTTQDQSPSVLFTFFVMCQLFNAFNSRELSTKSIFSVKGSNRLMLYVFAGVFLLQVVITQHGGAFFGTTPLPLAMWLKITAAAATVILASELSKLIMRRKDRGGDAFS